MRVSRMNKHTFVICAYRESPYLEDCIRSLRAQTVKSRIIMVTSTPNDFIQGLAGKYQIPCYVNEGEGALRRIGISVTQRPAGAILQSRIRMIFMKKHTLRGLLKHWHQQKIR